MGLDFGSLLMSSLMFFDEFLWNKPDLRYRDDFILPVDEGEGVLQYLFEDSVLRFLSISFPYWI
jgi:hypothetical protein